MTTSSKKQCKNQGIADTLQELLDHHAQMLSDAELRDWEKVKKNEVIHEQLIKAFYSKVPHADEVEIVKNATHELLLVNEKLKKLAAEARDKVKTQLTEIGKGKLAVNAYSKHMR